MGLTVGDTGLPAVDPHEVIEDRVLNLLEGKDDIARQQGVAPKILDALENDRAKRLVGDLEGQGDGAVARHLDPAQLGIMDFGKHDRHGLALGCLARLVARSEEHTSELQSLMRISYAVFCLKKKK